MQQQTYSRTALRVAMRRAAHQVLDHPLVFEDPFAIRILPPVVAAEIGRESQPFARAMRAFIAVRTRFAEDEFAEAARRGVRQYVALGAGLDTFAWRNPHGDSGVRIFEVDHPATQAWKRELIVSADLPESAATYVPVDFERQSLVDCLHAAGFHTDAPAFFSWLGVVPYLTLDAFRNTLRFFGGMAAGSGAVLDYALPREAIDEERRAVFDDLSARVASIGEPFQLFFMPEDLASEFHAIGWRVTTELDATAIRQRFFADHVDAPVGRNGMARLVSARK